MIASLVIYLKNGDPMLRFKSMILHTKVENPANVLNVPFQYPIFPYSRTESINFYAECVGKFPQTLVAGEL